MTVQRRTVGIIGAGAMGTFYGYFLAAENEVTLLDVRESAVAQISKSGIAVDGAERRKVKAATNPARIFDSAVLFLFVKANDTLRALRPFAGKLNPSTPIVSLQNGIGNEEAIKTALGGSVPLILGITTEAAVEVEPGDVKRVGHGKTVLGSGGASPATVESAAALLGDSGLATSVVYDIRPHLWGKLVANAAINPVTALLNIKNGEIPSDPDAEALARALATEAAAVAKASRVNLPFTDPWQYVCEVIEANADARNSMAVDLKAGVKTEIDHINGAITAAGRRAGVPTPYNDAMRRLIKSQERRALSP